MKILLTSQVYPPETHPTAIMVRELATHLVARGHEVTVACGFPHHPAGQLLGGYKRRLLLCEQDQGVQVVRGWHLVSHRSSTLVRAGVMVSQAFGTALAAHFVGFKPDLVLNYGPPLAGPLLSSTVAWRYHAPMVTVIYDIYPDIAVETGRVRSSAIIAAASWLERRTYRVSNHLIVLSEGFRRTLVARDVSAEKINVVPVWLNPDEIQPSPRLNSWRAEQNIDPATLVVLYAGTIGIVSGAEVVVEVADRLRGSPNLLFLLVGEGHLKPHLVEAAKARGLDNIRFLPFQHRSRLNEVQSTADVSVVTLDKGRGRTSVPSKVVGYLAAGRPIIASVDLDSETARCVSSGPSGVVVPPGDVEGLVAEVSHLMADPVLRTILGINARRDFDSEYSSPAALDRFAILLEGYAQTSARRPSTGPADPAHDIRLEADVPPLIRAMRPNDVARAADVHSAAFAGFFLTSLGPRFLRLLYGQAVAVNEIVLVSEVGGAVVGLVMGSTQPRGFYSKLIRRRLLAFGLAALPLLLRRPLTAKRIVGALSQPSVSAKPAGTATLMSLAVWPTVHGYGIGRHLVEAFLQEAARRGARVVDLTTDRDYNGRVNRFYENLGFEVSRQRVTPAGRVLNEYSIDLNDRRTGEKDRRVEPRHQILDSPAPKLIKRA